MRWLDSITDSTDMRLGRLREMAKDREAWRGVTGSPARLRDWTAIMHGAPEWRNYTRMSTQAHCPHPPYPGLWAGHDYPHNPDAAHILSLPPPPHLCLACSPLSHSLIAPHHTVTREMRVSVLHPDISHHHLADPFEISSPNEEGKEQCSSKWKPGFLP